MQFRYRAGINNGSRHSKMHSKEIEKIGSTPFSKKSVRPLLLRQFLPNELVETPQFVLLRHEHAEVVAFAVQSSLV